eukprot:CAMPEP_0170854996 /NCGR_PEP_ID=MMETSP0734-20130129/13593_1 /TAXON_ID=186038 /ORGANISM="Fragilariopsis kerguelensis, Strain L26-C5" /LENGTH=47 /DNA_ID= /DNA_START= /DNA_END= /DNA_ORIENTATION=
MPLSELWNVLGAGTTFSVIFTILCFGGGGGTDNDDNTDDDDTGFAGS